MAGIHAEGSLGIRQDFFDCGSPSGRNACLVSQVDGLVTLTSPVQKEEAHNLMAPEVMDNQGSLLIPSPPGRNRQIL